MGDDGGGMSGTEPLGSVTRQLTGNSSFTHRSMIISLLAALCLCQYLTCSRKVHIQRGREIMIPANTSDLQTFSIEGIFSIQYLKCG
jgi:hypothetical protein